MSGDGTALWRARCAASDAHMAARIGTAARVTAGERYDRADAAWRGWKRQATREQWAAAIDAVAVERLGHVANGMAEGGERSE